MLSALCRARPPAPTLGAHTWWVRLQTTTGPPEGLSVTIWCWLHFGDSLALICANGLSWVCINFRFFSCTHQVQKLTSRSALSIFTLQNESRSRNIHKNAKWDQAQAKNSWHSIPQPWSCVYWIYRSHLGHHSAGRWSSCQVSVCWMESLSLKVEENSYTQCCIGNQDPAPWAWCCVTAVECPGWINAWFQIELWWMALPVAQTRDKQNIGSQGHILPFGELLCLQPIASANRRRKSRWCPDHSRVLLLKGKVSFSVQFGKKSST